MQIKITNADFGFGERELLHNFSFEVNNKDKIAIIGRNGSGKTTLLKIISGELELHQPDNAPLVFVKIGSPTIGSLKQMAFEDENETMEAELLKSYGKVTAVENKLGGIQKKLETDSSDKLVAEYSRLLADFERLGGYTYRAELASAISSFGFSDADKHKKLCEFSGGQKTKLAFIKLVLSRPDVLLLDEPTNHLDINAVSWLENFIRSYENAVVMVSHDREFLDNTANIIYEIEHSKLTRYVGNYSKFVQTKTQNYESQLKAYEAQQREIADIKEFIERFRYKATKAAAVQSRIKFLEKLDIIPKPEKPETKAFKSKFRPNIQSGSEALAVTNLKIGYSKDNPLATLNFKVHRGDRLAILGGNGLGKSTLLETLAENIAALSGNFKFGYNTEVGYFKQIVSKFNDNNSIFESYQKKFPDLSGNEVRSSLGAFLFTGEDVIKPLSSLSGGEIVRFELCSLLEKRPNVLLLDEPTNHMDIRGKETLENLLLGYGGTVIFVSHDRYFINKLATKLLIFKNGSAEIFDGTYHQYLYSIGKSPFEFEENLKLNNKKSAKIQENTENKPEKIEYPVDFDENNVPEDEFAGKSYYELSKEKGRIQNRLDKISEKTQDAEKRIAELDAEFVNPEIASDFKKLMEIEAEKETLSNGVSEMEDEWLELSEKLEKIENKLNLLQVKEE